MPAPHWIVRPPMPKFIWSFWQDITGRSEEVQFHLARPTWSTGEQPAEPANLCRNDCCDLSGRAGTLILSRGLLEYQSFQTSRAV